MSASVQCPTCPLQFKNIFALGGHKQWCKQRAPQRALNADCAEEGGKRQKVTLPSENVVNDFEDVEEWRDLPELVEDDVPEEEKNIEIVSFIYIVILTYVMEYLHMRFSYTYTCTYTTY